MRAIFYIVYLVIAFLLLQFGLSFALTVLDALPESISNIAWYCSLAAMILIPNLFLVKLVLKLKWLHTFLATAIITSIAFVLPYLLIKIFWIKSEFQLPFGILSMVIGSVVMIELVKIRQTVKSN
jgi:hypothetical protein